MGTSATPATRSTRERVDEHILEIVSDSGEGAQKAGQIFGAVSAKMGNGVWTVEIIPAEIKPPARSRAGASGIRLRLGSHYITNMGDAANMVVAFNEQVIYGRLQQHAFRPGTVVLLEDKAKHDPQEIIRQQYADAMKDFEAYGLEVHELAIEEACKEVVSNPRLGKNMFVVGMLAWIYNRDLDKIVEEVARVFARKGEKVIDLNHQLLRAGVEFAKKELEFAFDIPSWPHDEPMVVMNGNQATGLGIMASGMDVVAMYPITPATSVSHYLADAYQAVGGFMHQAEDEIAAVGFAIGASYAGKTACTITSGPGLALKTEFIGLASMSEVPLVIVVVQRGGPSTGLPTKVEQGELLASLHGCPGDAPKIVVAPATIAECYHFTVLARQIAESFRTPVVVLTDANLATGVQPFPRPKVSDAQMEAAFDQSPWDPGVAPYDWDNETGLSPRPIPGQRDGEYVLTGLAHTRDSKVAYDPDSNQIGCTMRSRKMAAFQCTLKPPTVYGDEEGDLLIVGWGSTLGSIEEAVDRLRADGLKVSSLHVRFLAPLEPGLRDIFSKFKHVMTFEINYSDDLHAAYVTRENRRRAQLARVLRERTMMDIDCWSVVQGQPIAPGVIEHEVRRRMSLDEW